MDSNTFQLTCPICGRTDIGSYQSHLQTHSKQALIDTLINQRQIITPNLVTGVKRALEPEFVSVDPTSAAEDADTPGGSTTSRRSGITLRHGHGQGQYRSRSSHSRRVSQPNPLALDNENAEIFTSAASLLEEEQPLPSSSVSLSALEEEHQQGQCHITSQGQGQETPLIYELNISNAEGEEEPHLTVCENSVPICSFAILMPSSDGVPTFKNTEKEVEDMDEDGDVGGIQFDEEQVLELVSEEGGDASEEGNLYVSETGHDRREMETATTLALKMTQIPKSNGISNSNFIKYIIDETGTRAVVDAEPGVKWIFPDGVAVPVYSSFNQVPASSSQHSSSSMTPAGIPSSVNEEDSSLSNSKGHSSGSGRIRSDVNLMTDEEIPPRGEISEYEESNTSSLLSDDSKHGLISSSLGSMFSNRVRHLSPVIDRIESLSSSSNPKKRRSKSIKSSSLTMTSSFTSPEGHRCSECIHEQYFSTIFELAQHHAEVHQKPFISAIKKRERHNRPSGLDPDQIDMSGGRGMDWLHSLDSYNQRKSMTMAGPSVTVKDDVKRIYKRKEFNCLYCVFCTIDKHTLTKHIVQEHTSKLLDPSQYECTTCGKMFLARANLVKHLLIHRGKRHTCDQCNKAFTSAFKLKEHYRVHTRDYPFGCTQCDRSFRTPSLRTAHIRRDHEGIRVVKPKLEFYCSICHRVLHSKAGLLSHTQTHREQISKCPYCQETFPKKSILVRHIRIAHDSSFESKDSKECPVCFKRLHPNSMKSHLRIHKGEKPFPCPVCSMTFRTYANLTSHSWSHTNQEKPFKCKKCPKSYLFKKYLDSHMIVHKRRTSHFTCNECGVKFTSKMNMKRHTEEHFKEKKFKCKACGKCFHRKYYLSEHERIHSNIKPFTCSICGKTSTTKSNHRSHVRIHDARESGTLEV